MLLISVKLKKKLKQIKRLIELEGMTYIDSYSIGHLLFDVKENPKQNNPLNNEVIENMMKEKLVKK